MNATTDREVGVSTLGDIRSAAVVAAQAQIEHTHEVRRCLKRWPVRMKDEIEQYSRPSRQAVSKQGWGYVDTIREDLETEGEHNPHPNNFFKNKLHYNNRRFRVFWGWFTV
jgi:hypothetical protein